MRLDGRVFGSGPESCAGLRLRLLVLSGYVAFGRRLCDVEHLVVGSADYGCNFHLILFHWNQN